MLDCMVKTTMAHRMSKWNVALPVDLQNGSMHCMCNIKMTYRIAMCNVA